MDQLGLKTAASQEVIHRLGGNGTEFRRKGIRIAVIEEQMWTLSFGTVQVVDVGLAFPRPVTLYSLLCATLFPNSKQSLAPVSIRRRRSLEYFPRFADE
jgi:hypothetical protein